MSFERGAGAPTSRRTIAIALSAAIALLVSLLAAAPAAAQVSRADTSVSAVSPSASAPAALAQMASSAGFDPSNIISDALFYDRNAMTSAQIQSFLDQRVGTCNNGKCLNLQVVSVSSRDARYSTSTGNLVCGAIQGGTMKASELIYRVQVACGISAKVILVTLQKEQGLVTSKAPSDWNLTAAMGQACPDTAPCDPAFKGLGPQIVGGVTQLKIYQAARFGKQPGNNYIQYNPKALCGGTTINIKNWATASLYTYTPYQPNAAALRAGYGFGDSCSSYGNRNFYNYYTDWFGSTQASPDPCAQPIGARPASKAYVVNAGSLNARIAPNTSCAQQVVGLSQGTILQAVAVHGEWLKVRTGSRDRWVHRDYVRYATPVEAACALPGGVTGAKLAYVVTTPSAATRVVPHAECATSAGELTQGTIVQALQVNQDRTWVKVRLENTERWMARSELRRATAPEASCAIPGSVGSAKLQYVVRANGAAVRTAPHGGCNIGRLSISGDTVVQALEVNGPRDWLKIQTGRGDMWVSRSDVVRAADGQACSVAQSVRPVTRGYVVVDAGATAYSRATIACSEGSMSIPGGAVFTPIGSTHAGDWLQVRYGRADLWLPRSSVRYATEAEICGPPADARAAVYSYQVVTESAVGRLAPRTGCTAGSSPVAHGVIAPAVEATGDGEWVNLALPEGPRWIARADLARHIEPGLDANNSSESE